MKTDFVRNALTSRIRSLVVVIGTDSKLRELLCFGAKLEGNCSIGVSSIEDLAVITTVQGVSVVVLEVPKDYKSYLQVLSELKNDPRFENVPVMVVSSAETGEAAAKEFLELGASCFVAGSTANLDSWVESVRRMIKFFGS